jgi:hypothetical protein
LGGLQLNIGQYVVLVNPKNPRQKVAFGKINGRWGFMDKFHGLNIPKFWIKVDVAVEHVLDVPLMHPYEVDDQVVIKDVVGSCTLWNLKYVKVIG